MGLLARRLALSFLISALAVPVYLAGQQESDATEQKVKAAYLYNFTKFIKWPPNALPSPTAPFTICTTASGEFANILENTVRDKGVDTHPILIKRIKPPEFRGCQMIYMPSRDLGKALRHSSDVPTGALLVSDTSDANEAAPESAMITFVPDSTRIRFAIRSKMAEKAGMEISSRLLSLAIRVDR